MIQLVLPAVFAGSGMHAYFQLASRFPDTADRIVAAAGTGLGTTVGGLAGLLVGATIAGAIDSTESRHALAGLFGLLGLGIAGDQSYDWTKDYLVDAFTKPAHALEQPAAQTSGKLSNLQNGGMTMAGPGGQNYVLNIA